jgi:hypothetical protein
MKPLEFAKYYDITELAKEYNPDYASYEKIYICIDTWDFWIARIAKDLNEDYEVEKGSILVERNKIQKERGQGLRTKTQIENVLEDDDLGNWDYEQVYSLKEAIELIDDGFGIGTLS